MKKYPLSSKAVKIMIATALVAAPLAATPVFAEETGTGGEVVVEGEGATGDTTVEETTTEETTVEETTVEETTTEETTVEETTVEETTTEETTVEAIKINFKDSVDNHWANDSINRLSELGIIKGLDNGSFGYRGLATRSQMAVFITRSLGLEATADYKNEFTDVKGTEWFAADFAAAVEAGIVKGKGAKTAAPAANVTREEAAVMIVRALEHAGFDLEALEGDKTFATFKDANKASTWAVEALEVVVKADIFNGKTATTFDPKANITRAEIAVALDRFLSQFADEEAEETTVEETTVEETTVEETTVEETTTEGTTTEESTTENN